MDSKSISNLHHATSTPVPQQMEILKNTGKLFWIENDTQHANQLFKIIIVGDTDVGKTSILARWNIRIYIYQTDWKKIRWEFFIGREWCRFAILKLDDQVSSKGLNGRRKESMWQERG
jgi:hypothetical protein